ncbi:MAG: molybdate ABC transporter substrate-binding protein [Actinomycetaceae bacterium]|nr:molybdate ABC transporter substrate-binding protein [Actinomycetaceae bacterium]
MSRFTKSIAAAGTVALAALALAGCSNSTEGTDAAEETPTEAASQEIIVFAAASLNKVFEDISTQVFEPENPGVNVSFSFEGSSTLADQIQQGAPADVFASADERNMQKVLDAELVDEAVKFTQNDLTLIVPAGNPAGVTGLDDSLDGIKLVVCHPEVPCGNLTTQVFEEAGVALNPVSEEQKVTDVRGKIESGEGDAGFVYHTDAIAAGDKVEVIPMSVQGTNKYMMGVVNESKNAELAQKFVDAVMSDEGQALLESYGFSK